MPAIQPPAIAPTISGVISRIATASGKSALAEAILSHGGEARPERDAFVALPDARQAELIEFLKSKVVTD